MSGFLRPSLLAKIVWRRPTRSWGMGLLWAMVALAAARCSTAGVPDEPGDWLNVQDYGASGSEFETTASATAGSKQITVANVGDFKVGQGVMVSKCNVGYTSCFIKPPDSPYSTGKPVTDEMELRGYDGSAGSWTVFLIEFDGALPATFRWSGDLARTWKGRKVPVTGGWQPLSQGTEIRFRKKEWQLGGMITFSARDQLATTIEKIEGNVLTLRDPANRTVKDAVVRHEDTAALQAVIARAIQEKRNVFFPNGTYRLLHGLSVSNASGITLEGASGELTVLDISEGTGACFGLHGGTEVTIRNFRMIGHTGNGEGGVGFITSAGYTYFTTGLKACRAVHIAGTERVLVENVHATRMACEVFYAQAPARSGKYEPPQYTKSITYLRCSVTDSQFDAFNNNDLSESTSVLYCRAENVGQNFWEGPGRFIRLVGNYIRNCGPMSVGNMFHRYPELNDLGCAQTIVEDNVFEGGYEGKKVYPVAIWVSRGASQVIVRNNLFVNFGSTAIYVDSSTDTGGALTSFPARNVTVTGNILDLTSEAEQPRERTGIFVSASDTIVSDNQIYVRGNSDPKVTGILLSEPAVNLNVHDNLIKNCGGGLKTQRVQDVVGEVVDKSTFLRRRLPLEWRDSHLYRGWNLVWISHNKPTGLSVIDSFDPETLRFRLQEPRDMKPGDTFEVFPPYGANWSIHDNTITGCLIPVVFDSYGSDTSAFTNNIVSRGDATGVMKAVVVAGRFDLIGNHFSDFDEPNAAALALLPDRIDRPLHNVVRGNVFARCFCAVAESRKGLWEAFVKDGNQFLGCGKELNTASGRQAASVFVK